MLTEAEHLLKELNDLNQEYYNSKMDLNELQDSKIKLFERYLNPKNVGCPCYYTIPCNPNCTCINQGSSYGCNRCCTHGNIDQKIEKAKFLSK